MPDEGDRPILMSNGITHVSGRFCAGCARKISEDGKDYCPDRRCFEARSQDMRERIESYRRCIDDALRDSIVEVCSEDPRGMFIRFSNDLLQESFPFADQLGITIDETDSETVILEKVCILHFMSSIGLGRYTPELVLDQYRNFCKDRGIKPKSLMSWSDCLKEIASEMSEDIPPIPSESGEVGTSDEEVHA